MTAAGRRFALVKARLRAGRSTQWAMAALMMMATGSRVAHADNTWDPSGDRMAVTDRSITTDIQPRIWMLTDGGLGGPARLLVSRRPDLNTNGWFYNGVSGLDSGLDAVSWPDGTTQRQRVFYVKNGGVYMLPFDNDVAGTPFLISFGAQALGYQMQNTDLGAVTFTDGSGTRWMAVAAGATFASQAGYICIFESSDLGANWWNSCSLDRPLPSSNHDIVGVIADGSSTPEFYFQNLFATLSRARRTGTNAWIFHEEISVPTFVNASLVAMPAQRSLPPPAKIELGFIGSDNLVHTVRILPTDFPAATSWQTQAALPGGVLPFIAKTSLGGTAYHATTTDRENIYVIGQNLGLYQLTTTDQQGTWRSFWTGPYVSPSGLVATVGTVTTTTGDTNRFPRVFGAVGFPAAYTLQEFVPQLLKFNDYIKIQGYPLGVGNAGIAIAETSGASDNWRAIMSGTDRNYTSATSPWLVRLRSSTDGGNSFDATDSVVVPFGGASWFLTDSTVANDAGLLHLAVNDVQYPANGCHHDTHLHQDNAIATKISYRRGTSAAAIAALSTPGTDAYLVDDAPSNAGLDHPWMVHTPDGAAHVVYSGGSTANLCGSGNTCYWKLSSSGSVTRTPIGPLAGVPRAVKGANNEVYAFPDTTDGWSKICTLKNAFTTGVVEADCTMLGSCMPGSIDCDTQPDPTKGLLRPKPSGTLAPVYVGPELAQYPTAEMECQPQPQTNKKYKCFNTYALRSVAADPTTNYKVYVAYMASGDATPGLYFTRSNGGANWGMFTDRVLIAQNTTNVFVYDPQVTVDTDGTIIVSYSTFATAPGDPSGNTPFRYKMSTDGGTTFSGPYSLAIWDSSSIPYHCGRGTYFVGEYRDSNAFGNRAYVNFQSGGTHSSPYIYQTGWVNQWNLY